MYLHVSAVDESSNVSTPTTIKLTPQDNIIFSYQKIISENTKSNLIGAISSKGITNIEVPSLKDTNSQLILSCSNKNQISIDYPISIDTTIIANVTLSDGSKIYRQLTLTK